jgi:hypothetical protein
MKAEFTGVVLWIAGCGFLAMFVAFYFASVPPPGRAWVVPQYVLITGVCLCAYLAGCSRRASP